MSHRGNNDGYILIDAIVALLITALAAGAVFSSLALVVHHAGVAVDRALVIIEERNAAARRGMGFDSEE